MKKPSNQKGTLSTKVLGELRRKLNCPDDYHSDWDDMMAEVRQRETAGIKTTLTEMRSMLAKRTHERLEKARNSNE